MSRLAYPGEQAAEALSDGLATVSGGLEEQPYVPPLDTSKLRDSTVAITEKNRRDLFNHLEEAIGTDPAHTLMELLPLEPSNELVTRQDMHAFGTELSSGLRGEMSELRAEIRGDMAELRGEFRALEGRFDSRFAELQVNTQRLFAGAIAANVIALVTALAT